MGVNTTVMKVGYKYISPFPFNVSRLYVAVICAWAIVYFTGSFRKIDRGDIKKILTVCLLGFALLQFSITIGINNTPAGTASLILAMLPISVVIINSLFKYERITKQSIFGIIFSFLGVLFIIARSGKGVSFAGGWLSVLYSGIFGLVVGNVLWGWGIKRVGSTRTSVYNNLPPVFTVGRAFRSDTVSRSHVYIHRAVYHKDEKTISA